jgi:hypothetical protein
MPSGKGKSQYKAKDILILGTEEQHRVIVYHMDDETGVTLLRSISKNGRRRFNGWWRLKMKYKDDREKPLWWDEPSKAIAVPDREKWLGDPKDKKDRGIKGKLEDADFILVELDLIPFLDRKYDIEEE